MTHGAFRAVRSDIEEKCRFFCFLCEAAPFGPTTRLRKWFEIYWMTNSYLFSSFGIVWVTIRMPFHRQLAIGFLQAQKEKRKTVRNGKLALKAYGSIKSYFDPEIS
jgi:hypothetical protein